MRNAATISGSGVGATGETGIWYGSASKDVVSIYSASTPYLMVDDVEIYVSLRAKVLCLNLRYQRELVLPVYLLPKSSGYVAKSKNPVRIAVGSLPGFYSRGPTVTTK